MPEFNFDEDVAIDLDNLHEEWRTHPQIRCKYAAEVAHLDKVVKQQNKLIEVKKTKLKMETSKLILNVKEENPKFTVQQVDATIIGHKKLASSQKELSDAQDELIEIEYDLNMARNSLKAFDDRKTALENEVSLWKGNYFATPREERPVEGGKRIMDIAKDEKVQKGRVDVNVKRRRRNE